MLWLFLLIILAPAAIFTAAYNRLLTARIALKNAFSQIDVLLTRRYGLVPNLFEGVREQLTGEHAALDRLLAQCHEAHESLKSAASDPGSADAVHQLAQADQQLGRALAALLALAQRHPGLAGTSALTALTEELTVTERKVAWARAAYNSAVTTYNSGRATFPGSMAASYFGFAPAHPLPAAGGEEHALTPVPRTQTQHST